MSEVPLHCALHPALFATGLLLPSLSLTQRAIPRKEQSSFNQKCVPSYNQPSAVDWNRPSGSFLFLEQISKDTTIWTIFAEVNMIE